MNDKVKIKPYTPKSHIKVYGTDEFLDQVKEAAKNNELTASAFIATTIKNKLRRNSK